MIGSVGRASPKKIFKAALNIYKDEIHQSPVEKREVP
jgi:hypothetical protein